MNIRGLNLKFPSIEAFRRIFRKREGQGMAGEAKRCFHWWKVWRYIEMPDGWQAGQECRAEDLKFDGYALQCRRCKKYHEVKWLAKFNADRFAKCQNGAERLNWLMDVFTRMAKTCASWFDAPQ